MYMEFTATSFFRVEWVQGDFSFHMERFILLYTNYKGTNGDHLSLKANMLLLLKAVVFGCYDQDSTSLFLPCVFPSQHNLNGDQD